jgi:Fe-S oxidoreductase
MAGAFGVLEANLALSKKVAAPLFEAIQRLPVGSTVVASGTSCRHQIHDGATIRPLHAAELLAAALAEG